jgi:hypothetical protein
MAVWRTQLPKSIDFTAINFINELINRTSGFQVNPFLFNKFDGTAKL